MKVDIHTHLLPKEWPALEGIEMEIHPIKGDEHGPDDFVARLLWKDGRLYRNIKANCFDVDVVLSECDQFGVDVQVVCTVPVMFNYHLSPTIGMEWAKFLNDDLGSTVNKRKDRMACFGTLPMQCPEEAVKEMKRCVLDLGMRGFQIGSHINAYNSKTGVENIMLSDKRYMPIWETAKDLGVGIFVHPWNMEWCDPKYWLPWLVGMPAESSLAVCSVLLGGVIDKVPGIKMMFAHSAGSFPSTLGRVDWGYRSRPDLVAMDCKKSPSQYIRDGAIYIDSICHDKVMLKYLVGLFGADRIAMGSDYPFPLGEVPSVAPVTNEVLTAYPGELIETSEDLDDEIKDKLLCSTALDFLGMKRTDFEYSKKKLVKIGRSLPTL